MTVVVPSVVMVTSFGAAGVVVDAAAAGVALGVVPGVVVVEPAAGGVAVGVVVLGAEVAEEVTPVGVVVAGDELALEEELLESFDFESSIADEKLLESELLGLLEFSPEEAELLDPWLAALD